jgi:thiol-disulfide isomerase/thioredoxin
MRVFSCMLVLVCLCMTITGCSLFKKNTNGTSGNANGATPPKFPGAQDPLLNSNVGQPPPAFPATPAAATQTSAAKGNAILAGTVIDAYHRPIGNAYIRWVNLDESDAGAPIDVATDSGGHFIIQGVKPGASYKLIARTKQGEKMMAGTVLTSAPNVRVLIPMREDLVNASTPPVPGSPAYQGTLQKEGGSFGAAWNTPDATKKPTTGETPNLPATMTVPVPPTNTPVGSNPSNSAGNPTFVPGIVENANPNRLPMLTIPNPPLPPLSRGGDGAPPALPGDAKLNTGPTRVPSCVLVGSHLENMALKDSKGQTWEYKKQGQGKLILIDFWGTHCIYCRDTMPALNRLHSQYGGRGLEVIGIALEAGKDERREADAVNKLCASMQLSYRQLMGHVGSFDVGKNFRIEGVPTLFLLNEQGDIIWHYVGRPDPKLLEGLERSIQARLNQRPS